MPDTPSPFDDPLADLYGRLPEPRRGRSEGASGGGTPPSDPPLSRRQARAAREEAGDHPPITKPPAPPAPPRPVPAAPAAPPTRPIEQVTPGVAPSGSLDDLFTGERSTDDMGARPPKKNRRQRTGGWIALGIVVVLVGAVVGGGFWAANTYGPRIQEFFSGPTLDDYEAGLANGETSITIVSGDAGPQVSQKAFDAGVTKTATSLYDYMIQNSVGFTFQPGVFRMQLQMTSSAVLDALRNPDNRLEGTVQLREGLTVEQSVSRIAEDLGMPQEEVQAAVDEGPAAYGVTADSLEGWIFPATYTFEPGTSAHDVISRMVARTVQSLDAAGVPVDDRTRILTIASIIEREGRPNDFAKVSRVIQNRLDQGMKLQMDSTAQYGYGELHAGSASTSSEAQFNDNPWNTYVIDGLPVGPIANPGDQAIAAAMSPADGPWLFFVTVNLDTGETVFTTTAEEHQAAVNQWIQWCRDNPDSGC